MQQSIFGSAVQEAPASSDHQTGFDTALADVVFTVIDLETTGLNPVKNSITEITAIQFKNGEEVNKYSTLVKPSESIPDEVQNITGISNEMVAHAPALVMALTELCSFVGSSPVIVGHNVSFDIRFLQEKLNQAGLGSFVERFDPEKAVCTKVLAQKALPGLPSYEGVVVANHCGVYNPNPHRAEYDVRMSAGILFVLIERLQADAATAQKMKTLANLVDFQGGI